MTSVLHRLDEDLQDTLTGVRPDIETVEEPEDDTAEACSTWTRYKGLRGLLQWKYRQCRHEAVWFCYFPCCGDPGYTCNKHLGNGHPWCCFQRHQIFKATDLPWRKIRR